MGKKMDVLLLKPLVGQGNAGDIIDVKIHYANHYLIPQGYAIPYTKQVKNQRDAQEKKIKRAKAELYDQVKDLLAQIEKDGGVIFYKQATDPGKLYDSITEGDIANQIHMDYQLHLDTEHFNLEEKIERLGTYTVEFTYKDISGQFPIKVIRKEDILQ